MVYTNTHRFFLQMISNLGKITEPDAISCLTKAFETFEQPEHNLTLDNVIQTINNRIEFLDQKITGIHYDVDDQLYYVYTTTTDSAINKFQTSYTENELNFFRLLIDHIVQKDDYSINSMSALNLCILVPKPLNKITAENLLESWCESGYFLESDDKLFFGPKLIVEFANYLKTNHANYVESCVLCKHLVFWGVNCEDCNTCLHKHCMLKYIAKQKKCPSCKKPWTNTLH